VGGYGPEQALLKLEGLIDRFPSARVVVLAITYDDFSRMVNSYRPVLILFQGGIPSGLNLRAVYDRFAHLAQSRNLHAVIAFIPTNGGDRTTGLLAIAAATEQQRAHISFTNVGRDFDWSSFHSGCHPSPVGYHMIAADVARVVAPLLATNQ
jgi:hypothetical protein